jgi:hypothetical protein
MKRKERRITGLYMFGSRLRGNLRACRRLAVFDDHGTTGAVNFGVNPPCAVEHILPAGAGTYL